MFEKFEVIKSEAFEFKRLLKNGLLIPYQCSDFITQHHFF